ncbi:MAG: cytochrome c1 [Hyphomicrobiaceae bacterium]|nr:MAG: cytochrome c1 [Hyphomicrobiaceae bacterium]
MTTSKLLPRAAAAAAVLGLAATGIGMAASTEGPAVGAQHWSFAGLFGHFDQGQLQRGYKIYEEVCAGCHSMNLMRYRNLGQIGGPRFSEAAVQQLAKSADKIADTPDDQGKPRRRARIPSDPFPAPYTNEQQARSTNGGALPPDLSVIAKARGIERHIPWYQEPLYWLKDIASGYQEAGADYVYALLIGYGDVPLYVDDGKGHLVPLQKGQSDPKAKPCASIERQEGKPDQCVAKQKELHYNAAFPGNQIAMAPPLAEGKVKYDDGTKPTLEQHARDVTAFLMWAADPKLEERKRMGILSLLYIAVTSLLLYFAKKRLWAKLH